MNLHSSSYAIYLPAVNASYLNTVARPLPQGRRFPHGTTPKDLMFWEPNGLWNYPFWLHSIGQYKVGSALPASTNKSIRSNNTLVGDSGGFQIGKGSLGGLRYLKSSPMNPLDAYEAWGKEKVARNWITNWLSDQCDYAMTIDMPLWAKDRKGVNSPFHRCSTEQLIEMTVKNLHFIDAFSPSHVRWLNVIQGGRTVVDAVKWWDSVKWFRKGGWAMAGTAGAIGGLFNMLAVLLMMRDEDAFVEGQDWLHVLGVSTPFWAIALTAIQKALKDINPNLTVSYDSSSPFQMGGRFEHVCLTPAFGRYKLGWSIRTVLAPQRPLFASSQCKDRFPYQQSPIGSRLLLNELNVKEGAFSARQFDSLSVTLLTNHNIWVYLNAFKSANDLVYGSEYMRVPQDFIDCVDLIGDLFMQPNQAAWMKLLEKNRSFLDSVAPYRV
jgi:hypothetical protein